MATYTTIGPINPIVDLNPDNLRVIRVDNISEDEKFNWAKPFDCISAYTRKVSGGADKAVNLKRYVRGW